MTLVLGMSFKNARMTATTKNGNQNGCRKSLIKMVAKGGIEPPTRGFSIRCSTTSCICLILEGREAPYLTLGSMLLFKVTIFHVIFIG